MLVFLRDKTIEMSCIYYLNKENLTYNKKEHIFPATIGGIETLPVGYVSDQANEYFSSEIPAKVSPHRSVLTYQTSFCFYHTNTAVQSND